MFICIHIMYMTVCAGPWELEPTAGAMSENGHQMWSSSHQMWLPSHANGRGEALILVPFSPLPASAMAPNFSPSRQILNRYHRMSTALHLSPENAWVTYWNILEHARVCAKTRSQSSHMPQRLPAECALHRFVGKHGDRSKLLVFRLSLAVALGFPQPRKGVQFHYVPPISDTYNDHISPLIGDRTPW